MTASTGAIVGAATTSLPERLESGRNYDYRYAWIRDQCYAGLAVGGARPAPAAGRGPWRFITERVLSDGPDLMPAYTVSGQGDSRRVPDPGPAATPAPAPAPATGSTSSSSSTRSARCSSCWPPRPARTGWRQDGWRAAQTAVTAIEQRWTKPEAGLWELDDQPLDPLPAGLRGRPAFHRRRDGRPARRPWRPPGGGLDRPGRPDHGQPRRRRAPLRAVAARSRRRARRRGAAAAADPGRGGPLRPADRRQLRGRPCRPVRGRLRLPVPARRPAAARGRGRLPAVRPVDGPGRAGVRRRGRGRALVRAQPRGLRPRHLHRGVRRAPAPAAGQPAAGVQVHAGVLETAARLSRPDNSKSP